MSMKISIVTVVYQEEINFLKIQAQSLDVFFKHEDIDSICIIINDRHQRSCRDQVVAMLPMYGALSKKVKIFEPDQIIGEHKYDIKRPLFMLKKLFVHYRSLIPIKIKSGWRGNNGWLTQQAFKLCVARVVKEGFVLILDSKNFFVNNVNIYDFVSNNHRARTLLVEPYKSNRRWIDNSFKIFGMNFSDYNELASLSRTPFCIRADILKDCLNEVERRIGPIEVYFGYRPLWGKGTGHKASEFMLMYAYITYRFGNWKYVFDEGLLPASSINKGMKDHRVDHMISLVEKNEVNVFSVHKSRVHNLKAEHIKRIRQIFECRGLSLDSIFSFS